MSRELGGSRLRGVPAPCVCPPLYLIHTTKSPNPITARLSGRFGPFHKGHSMSQKVPQFSPCPGLFAGLFRSPCGVWVIVETMRSGLPWARPLAGVTSATVLRGAYADKTKI